MKKTLLIISILSALFLAFLIYLGSDEEAYQESLEYRLHKALTSSDDYDSYQFIFIEVSQKLVNQKKCSVNDFKKLGGWLRSPNKGSRYYFTYCGGMTVKNKLYLDIITKEISYN